MMNTENLAIIQSTGDLVADMRSMIAQTRDGVARTVNTGMTLLYWRIGKRIHHEILGEKRAEYGKEIVSTLSRQLVEEFGNGFSEKNLRRMVQFAEVFPDSEIVVSVIRQLNWAYILSLIPLKQPLQHEFYERTAQTPRTRPIWSNHKDCTDKGVLTYLNLTRFGVKSKKG